MRTRPDVCNASDEEEPARSDNRHCACQILAGGAAPSGVCALLGNLLLRRRPALESHPGGGAAPSGVYALFRNPLPRIPEKLQEAWREPDLNRRHHGFQPCALPAELPRLERGTV